MAGSGDLPSHLLENGGWESSAKAWIECQSAFGDWSRRVILDPYLESILENVDGKSVLDVGCGEGRYCRVLRERGAKTTGIDPVQDFVEAARSLDPVGDYVLGIAEELPFPDASFDLVLSYLTLIDIPDIRLAIPEMVRVLRPGGRLIVITISNFCCTEDPWVRDENGQKLHRPVRGYMDEKAIRCTWSGIDIINYHRPLSVVMGLFLKCGLRLLAFDEPQADSGDARAVMNWSAPNFQAMVWKKDDCC